MDASDYRGSLRHKGRPARGPKGTLCPEWTHRIGAGGFSGEPQDWNWAATEAHALFRESVADPEGSGRRFATRGGIAFVAQPSNDGTWHGYPEPWNKVPAALNEQWLRAGRITPKNLKRYKDFPRKNIRWALGSDDA
jgi:hypothetical protein